MTNVNKTLYIPLYGKAYVSRKGLFLSDKKAEEIWEKERFPLKGKSKSKWLAYYMGMRSAVFDEWVAEVYGVDNPEIFTSEKLAFVQEHNMTPQKYIDELKGTEKWFFSKVLAGGFSKKMYRLFEYKSK